MALFVVIQGLGLSFASTSQAETLKVGRQKTYTSPCAAIAVAKSGDVIEVDGGETYSGDVCAWSTDNLSLKAVGGRAKIDAAGKSSQDKGIWVIYAKNASVEGFEFTGAAVADKNGAGIRHQGLNLTIKNCYFHDNENGVLGSPFDGADPADGQGTVQIDGSEFSHNGAGDGYSHNIYLGKYKLLNFVGSYSHDAVAGHLFKSRALENHVLYSRFADGSLGSPSYELDFPNGGRLFALGNIVEQNDSSPNSTLLAYGEEGMSNPQGPLQLVNNTFINRMIGVGSFVSVAPEMSTAAVLANNIFFGAGPACTQASAVLVTNFTGNPQFESADYALSSDSPCVDAGTAPGEKGVPLLQVGAEYEDVGSLRERLVAGDALDIGAYEYGNTGELISSYSYGSSADGAAGAGGADGSCPNDMSYPYCRDYDDDEEMGLCSYSLSRGSSSLWGGLAALGVWLLSRRRRLA